MPMPAREMSDRPFTRPDEVAATGNRTFNNTHHHIRSRQHTHTGRWRYIHCINRCLPMTSSRRFGNAEFRPGVTCEICASCQHRRRRSKKKKVAFSSSCCAANHLFMPSLTAKTDRTVTRTDMGACSLMSGYVERVRMHVSCTCMR